MALLELRDIFVEHKRLGRQPVMAVAGVSLAIERGAIVSLVGETGCGKSTLARAAVGLYPLTAGSVWFEGNRLLPIGRGRRSSTTVRLQLVFQNPFGSLNPRRRVGDQIADALHNLNIVDRDRTPRRVAELLEEVGLSSDAAKRFPHEFSGGQRQRIAIARALAAEPSIVVMDEPFSALDSSSQAQLANLIVRLSHDRMVGFLVISHDLALVRQISDSIAVMYLGRIVEYSSAKEISTAALHPYTKALVAAIPHVDGGGTLPVGPVGEVPNPRLSAERLPLPSSLPLRS